MPRGLRGIDFGFAAGAEVVFEGVGTSSLELQEVAHEAGVVGLLGLAGTFDFGGFPAFLTAEFVGGNGRLNKARAEVDFIGLFGLDGDGRALDILEG
jgi:hypothetical protein